MGKLMPAPTSHEFARALLALPDAPDGLTIGIPGGSYLDDEDYIQVGAPVAENGQVVAREYEQTDEESRAALDARYAASRAAKEKLWAEREAEYEIEF